LPIERSGVSAEMMISGIHHIAISTRDIERSVEFYRDLLGFEEVLRFEWPVGSTVMDTLSGLSGSSGKIAMLKAANTFVEILQYETPIPSAVNPNRPVCDLGISHIALTVGNVSSEYARLTAAGMSFHCAPLDLQPGMRATYGRDPDGNVVELLEISDVENPMFL